MLPFLFEEEDSYTTTTNKSSIEFGFSEKYLKNCGTVGKSLLFRVSVFSSVNCGKNLCTNLPLRVVVRKIIFKLRSAKEMEDVVL